MYEFYDFFRCGRSLKHKENSNQFSGWSYRCRWHQNRNPCRSNKEIRRGDIVLTSDWKNVRIGGDLNYLRDKLAEHGLEIYAMTTDHWNNRGQGIQDYLYEHPEIDEYVILDDNRFDFEDFPNLWERLLITNGIQQVSFASKTPAVGAIIFHDYIKEFS